MIVRGTCGRSVGRGGWTIWEGERDGRSGAGDVGNGRGGGRKRWVALKREGIR